MRLKILKLKMFGNEIATTDTACNNVGTNNQTNGNAIAVNAQIVPNTNNNGRTGCIRGNYRGF